jgi:RNA polymerase sigma-70 factor (ECF subfamily)
MKNPDLPDASRLEAAAWIPRIRAGDVDALARWYRAEHPEVWRLCLGFLADPAEAEDAAQDAMLRLLDTLDRFDLRRPWSVWRNAVVLNHCRDRLRRDEARARAEREAARAALPPMLPHPADEAARGELETLVARSLRHLSPREREVFVLHDLEGGATADVAVALAIAESTVRVLLATARRRLRELLVPRLAGEAGGGAHHG